MLVGAVGLLVDMAGLLMLFHGQTVGFQGSFFLISCLGHIRVLHRLGPFIHVELELCLHETEQVAVSAGQVAPCQLPCLHLGPTSLLGTAMQSILARVRTQQAA